MVKKIALKTIKFYKKYLSFGYRCRMIPSCSEYMYEAIEKYGLVRGGWMGLKRLMKCHPWGGSGVDLVE